MKTFLILFSCSLLVGAGCAFQKLQAVLDEPMSGPQVKLPVAITKLTIADIRTATNARDLKISAIALPGRKDEIAPPLSGEQKDVLEKEFASYAAFTAGDARAACTVQVVEGSMKYTSAWSGEEMFVRSKLRMVLIDSLHTPFLASAVGEAEFSFKSNIANKKNFEKLYQKAMKAALFKAAESISGAVRSMMPGK